MTDQRSLGDRVLDIVVYAPAGLLLRLRSELPALVASGRRDVEERVRVAHWVGEMAVTYGRNEVQRRLAGPSATANVTDVTDTEVAASPPFVGYDALPADQLVQLLAKFPAAELAMIRLYEQKHRGRRTVLAKIDQLIDS